MNAIFADTFYFLAVLSEDDEAHAPAVEASQDQTVLFVTTAWVLTELGDALAAPDQRALFLKLLRGLEARPHVTIVPPSQELFDRGVALYAQRVDKDWPLTDCISFVVMREMNITDALTGDRHFEQAGFKPLLA